MKTRIALLPGDGVGQDVIGEAVKVLTVIAKKYHHQFRYQQGLVGGVAIDKTGDPFPKETLKICQNAEAILFGAVGDPKYDNPKLKVRPEQGLLRMRKVLGLFANFRPIKLYDCLIKTSPVKEEIVKGTDMVILRELTGGLYFGKPQGRRKNGQVAVDTCLYSVEEIKRICHLAFKFASKRKKHVTLVSKANILETSRLWLETFTKIAKKYPRITTDHLFVDIASMQLIKKPTSFDVIVTENMFGDILTDEAGVLAGSIGMLPSASFGTGKLSLYEPIHGSAPKYVSQNKVNPCATILSAALMLYYSFNLEKEARAIEKAVEKTLAQGFRTYDIMEKGCRLVTTTGMTEKIIKNLK